MANFSIFKSQLKITKSKILKTLLIFFLSHFLYFPMKNLLNLFQNFYHIYRILYNRQNIDIKLVNIMEIFSRNIFDTLRLLRTHTKKSFTPQVLLKEEKNPPKNSSKAPV
mgnify:CR=1 FL=1